MAREIVILILLACAHAGSGALSTRIIGGKDAEDGAYPYQASLRVNGMHRCGGSVIDRQWILTAAHCLKHEKNSTAVVLGSNNLSSGGVAYRVDKIIVHPDYNPSLHKHDIGLIKIKGYIQFRDTVAPIGLPSEDVDYSDSSATFTGWGNVKVSGSNNDELQVIELRVLELHKCQRTFSKVDQTNICTLTVAGQGICYGDSGSPLVVNGVQIGIASWGSPCANGYPDVHTRVYCHINWIRKHIVRSRNVKEEKNLRAFPGNWNYRVSSILPASLHLS